MTNVSPNDLNYDSYETEKYEDEIIHSIPGHKELHLSLEYIIIKDFKQNNPRIMELGIGTGLTTEVILQNCSVGRYIGIDFSEQMLQGAKKRLLVYHLNNLKFIIDDYTKINLPCDNNLVVSVIGIHHQETDQDKKDLFQKIYNSLTSNGVFLFGDLVTYQNKKEAALNDALHYHHLVENARDEQSLQEWAYHHKFLNKPAPIEDQIDWLKEIGFKEVEIVFRRYNTALIYAKK